MGDSGQTVLPALVGPWIGSKGVMLILGTLTWDVDIPNGMLTSMQTSPRFPFFF